MAAPNFLAENELRAYPFPSDRPPTMTRSDAVDVDLPTAAIVDATVLVGTEASWRAAVDVVYLAAVHRQADGDFLIEWRSGAPGLLGYAVFCHRRAAAAEFETTRHEASYADATSSTGSLPTVGDCKDTLIWLLVLTTGRLDTLAAVLAPGQSLTAAAGLMPLLAARVQDLAAQQVVSVNLANRNRLHARGWEECLPLPHGPYNDDDILVNATCLVGDLVLRAGYNLSLKQDARGNGFTLGAGVGAGLGEPCCEVALYLGEEPPPGSRLLGGGPTCNECITSINGLSAAHLTIRPGLGVTIDKDPARGSTIVLATPLADTTACEGVSLHSSTNSFGSSL